MSISLFFLSGLAAAMFVRRSLHKASCLPYKSGEGVGKFLSAKALKLITQMQDQNIEQLNRSVKGVISRAGATNHE